MALTPMSFDKVQTFTMIFDVFHELIVTYCTCHNSLLELVTSFVLNVWQITVHVALTSGPFRYCSLCLEALQTTLPQSANAYPAGDT